VLKEGLKRTVTVEEVGGVRRVVKRFHAPGRLDRWKDGHRARREARALEALGRRGLPVPRAVEVRQREGRWELVQEEVEGARSLDDILDGRAAWPVPAGLVAVRLGRVLAALLEAGLRHPDLHAGNVLLDSAGAPHLVDLARARFGKRVEVESLLVNLAAGVRERTTPSLRARVFLALRAACPRLLPNARERIERVERRARVARRNAILGRVARWRRTSGALAPFERGGQVGLLARGRSEELLDLARDGHSVPLPDAPERCLSLARSPDQFGPRWELAARLAMHDLPGERPLALIRKPEPLALFDAPLGARPLREGLEAADPAAARTLLARAGSVLGSLSDRGLAALPAGAGSLAVDESGNVHLCPRVLTRSDDPGPEPVLQLARELGLCKSDREPVASAFVNAHRGSAAERRRLTSELQDG